MEMSLDEAVWAVNEGYCLWVGAGVTRQVAAGHTSVPLWSELTRQMELAAGVLSTEHSDFPSRLDKCKTLLGETVFRSFLRERYYTQFCCALLSQAAAIVDREKFVPDSALCLAALGQMANPIISFNIEALSSVLLARPGGPFLLRFQQPTGKRSLTWREETGRFQRLAYHPHGLATADTVMTAQDYEANRQTLAFGVPIHAAFDNNLAIVGMSLDDQYLRRQIECFRPNIGQIYWFDSQFSDKVSLWADEYDIIRVRSEWNEFWQFWRELPIDFDRAGLATAWYLAVREAANEAEGGYAGSLHRSLKRTRIAEDSNFARFAARMAHDGSVAGEPGTEHLIDGKQPSEIAGAVQGRMIDAGFGVPTITKRY